MARWKCCIAPDLAEGCRAAFEVAKYFALTNQFRTPVVVVMRKAKFDVLPPEYKEIVTVTARETQDWAGSLYSEVSTTLLNHQIRQLPHSGCGERFRKPCSAQRRGRAVGGRSSDTQTEPV
jgi:hypothetical protein